MSTVKPGLALNTIRRSPGSTRNPIRVGRGVGSGVGGTSRKGNKGQKSRTGSVRGLYRFEGGQTPFWRRIPKAGFSNKQFELDLAEVNLDTIQAKLDRNLLNPTKLITMKNLVSCGAVSRNVGDGVKLLAKGNVTQPIDIEVVRASRRAIEKVEAAGGSVTVAWYTRLGIRALLKPEKFDLLPRRSRPPPKYMEYYTSDEHRGYLSPMMQMRKLGLEYKPVSLAESAEAKEMEQALNNKKKSASDGKN